MQYVKNVLHHVKRILNHVRRLLHGMRAPGESMVNIDIRDQLFSWRYFINSNIMDCLKVAQNVKIFVK